MRREETAIRAGRGRVSNYKAGDSLMKKFAPLSILALCAVAGFAFAGGNGNTQRNAPAASAAGNMDVIATAAAAGNFKTFASVLASCGLTAEFQGQGPFTVFAPTDEAFAKLPKGTIEELQKPENKDKLAQILRYHVIAGEYSADQVSKMKESSATLQGQTFDVNFKDGRTTIGNNKLPSMMATLTMTDIHASNGVIHAIDTVIMPRQ